MKKTILLFLAVATLTATAHEPEFSMYKKQENINTKQKKSKSGNDAGAWALAGGVSLFAGSMIKVFTLSDDVPDFANYTNLEEYKADLTKYNQKQKTVNTIFYASAGLTAFCLMISGIELMSLPIATTEKTALHLKTDGNSIGLCLNFK